MRHIEIEILYFYGAALHMCIRNERLMANSILFIYMRANSLKLRSIDRTYSNLYMNGLNIEIGQCIISINNSMVSTLLSVRVSVVRSI